MQIHQLSVTGRKGKKRIGRGGKRGTTSGRGSKGQKARSGASVDPLFEGGRSTFVERLKKVRGRKAVNPQKYTVTLAEIDRAFENGETVTVALLVERNVVSKKALSAGVKIVATGTTKKKLSLEEGIKTSEKAREALGVAG
ncbi:MAG: 50S ribosomal protein L15 [Candidatus Moranbacteria bacterium RIFCSPHIGHO2_01_FULL_55_24]|nr:MAG: 50S ribosomal protein L15 [Candidatus Moranbacteria bacterium RIFCSPHIGHO2_01_FULL_55_24]